MTTDEQPKKDTLRKGRQNYLAWFTRLETMLTLDDIVVRDRNDKLIIAGATNDNLA